MSTSEIDDLLAELDGAMDSPKNANKSGVADSKSSFKEMKSLPDAKGENRSDRRYQYTSEQKHQRISQTTKIRCMDCDFNVIEFANKRWGKGVDYMFFRNNFQEDDDSKLVPKLEDSRGYKAQCCQCKWEETNMPAPRLPTGWYKKT